MPARNSLLTAPPYAVETAVGMLGSNLRLARLRRNLTIEAVANKIGAGKRAVADAEHGKTSTSIATYAALLWAYDQLEDLREVANPAADLEGQSLERQKKRSRVRHSVNFDGNF